MNHQSKAYIFESPDGGETIYRRPVGESHESRELYKVSDKKKSLIEDLRKTKLWGEIHRDAQKDPVLKEMLDQIEIYYHLKNSP